MTSETFPHRQLYQFGYCAVFARGLAPAELLARAGGEGLHPVALTRTESGLIEARGEDIDVDDLPGVDLDQLHGSGVLASEGPVLRAGEHEGWSFVIEPEGSYLAADDILTSVSRQTVALCLRDSESGSRWISYAEDGEILSSCDPLFPDGDYGTRPQAFAQLAGHAAAISNGDRAEAYANAVRAIQQRLQCMVPREADESRLLTVKIADGY
ncbi:DUF6461 domain-containing protein [Streptomyces sp. WAC04114]|uniref:DUF6461 domain-containing protein n=1 Tax=Streptomyces sp. WAC04114 TaxID=2867961 RepID=UPI001C8B4CDB|nr:DUF6461 domain-containing protein [Streptomyces sp. WAC04114]MBX9362244.1 hypothetical protein [Streptomyces sp. WAC04114]